MQVRVSSGFFIVSAILLLTLPLQWAAALFLSSLIHEVCHLFALKLTGVSVCGLRLTAGGAYLQTAEMSPLQESVSALAGPMGALLLLLTARWMPRTAICAAIQSAYHLLPLYPLDGGRVIRGLTRYFGWPRIISRLLEWGVILLLSLSGICYWGSAVGVWLLAGVSAIIFRVIQEKYLAKNGGTGYNSPTNQCEVRL